jgi:putative intracellular protease/amidase
MQVALALSPGFTALDIFGPFQVLADVPGHDIVFVAGEAGPVIDHSGHRTPTGSATFSAGPAGAG